MRFFVLSKYKIQSLESGYCDLVVEDLIDVLSDSSTKIIDNEDSAAKMMTGGGNFKYKYSVKIDRL